MSSTPRLAAVLLVSLLCVPSAAAKDLRKRPGLGFTGRIGDHTALSARYGLPMPSAVMNVLVEVDAGFTTDGRADTSDGFIAGGRALLSVVAEDNMNLYVSAGAAYVTYDGSKSQAVRVQPGLSAEFFLFGLENLGFSADWGVSLDLGSPMAVTSFGAGPGLSVNYYF